MTAYSCESAGLWPSSGGEEARANIGWKVARSSPFIQRYLPSGVKDMDQAMRKESRWLFKSPLLSTSRGIPVQA